jgi:hypothetical protein
MASFSLWFVPYLAVMLLRSVWWSVKNLNISKRGLHALYGTVVVVGVIVAWAVTIAIMGAKEKERRAAATRARTNEEFAAQLLRQYKVDGAKAQLRFAADNWRIANQPDQEKRVRQVESELAWKRYPLVRPAAGAQSANPFDQFDRQPAPPMDKSPAASPSPKPTISFVPDKDLGIKKAVTASPAIPP